MKLIDKDAAVAEIEKLKGQLLRGACSSQINMVTSCKEEAYNEVLSCLDTLEVKEVDLDWKNVRELCVLSAVVELEKGRSLTDQEHYTEVIKRFKAQKG